MSDPALLTVEEAAARLRMSVRNVHRLVANGEIRALQGARHRRILITEDALTEYLRPAYIVRAEAIAEAGR